MKNKQNKRKSTISFNIEYIDGEFDINCLTGVMKGYFTNFKILSAELNDEKQRITIEYNN